jgi:dual specificity tyrosine-phosphorylation-regulated kinase 2/3/4
VIFGNEYSESIDIWSVGCILTELFSGFPLFPAENEVDLFNCMIEVLGLPPSEFLAKSQKKSMFFTTKNEPRIVVNSKGKKRIPGDRTLDLILAGSSEGFIDLVKSKDYLGCLVWEPEKRISPRQALEHEWFKSTGQMMKVTRLGKGHRYHMSDTQFNYSSYNKIFHNSQTAKCNERGNAF